MRERERDIGKDVKEKGEGESQNAVLSRNLKQLPRFLFSGVYTPPSYYSVKL